MDPRLMCTYKGHYCTPGLTLQETRSIHDSMNRSNIEFIKIFTLYYEYLKYENYF